MKCEYMLYEMIPGANKLSDNIDDWFKPIYCYEEATTTYETKYSQYEKFNKVGHYCAEHAIDEEAHDRLDRVISEGTFLTEEDIGESRWSDDGGP